jgi:hypothetical protein
MALGRKDLAATALTALVVLTFAATHEGWNVWLVGDSSRWASAVALVLGALTCGLGSNQTTVMPVLFVIVGSFAVILAVVAVTTGSLTALSLYVAADVLLWLAATVRHAVHTGHHPEPA